MQCICNTWADEQSMPIKIRWNCCLLAFCCKTVYVCYLFRLERRAQVSIVRWKRKIRFYAQAAANQTRNIARFYQILVDTLKWGSALFLLLYIIYLYILCGYVYTHICILINIFFRLQRTTSIAHGCGKTILWIDEGSHPPPQKEHTSDNGDKV